MLFVFVVFAFALFLLHACAFSAPCVVVSELQHPSGPNCTQMLVYEHSVALGGPYPPQLIVYFWDGGY